MALAEWARNPYGTYDQEERCIYCGSVLMRPRISVLQHVAALSARVACKVQSMLVKPRPNWMHVRFLNRGPGETAPRLYQVT